VTTNLIKKSPLAGEIHEHRQALAAIHGATKGANFGLVSSSQAKSRFNEALERLFCELDAT
jgi:hypothetical protein